MTMIDLAILLILGAPQVLLMGVTIFLWIEVKAMQKSTHQISFIDPLKQQFSAPMTDAEKEKLSESIFDNIN